MIGVPPRRLRRGFGAQGGVPCRESRRTKVLRHAQRQGRAASAEASAPRGAGGHAAARPLEPGRSASVCKTRRRGRRPHGGLRFALSLQSRRLSAHGNATVWRFPRRRSRHCRATKWGPMLPPTGTPKMRFAGLRERGRAVAGPAARVAGPKSCATHRGKGRAASAEASAPRQAGGHAAVVSRSSTRRLHPLGLGRVSSRLPAGSRAQRGRSRPRESAGTGNPSGARGTQPRRRPSRQAGWRRSQPSRLPIA